MSKETYIYMVALMLYSALLRLHKCQKRPINVKRGLYMVALMLYSALLRPHKCPKRPINRPSKEQKRHDTCASPAWPLLGFFRPPASFLAPPPPSAPRAPPPPWLLTSGGRNALNPTMRSGCPAKRRATCSITCVSGLV